MLIDDHPVVRAGLRAILDSFEDITVIAEGSGGTAVHQLIGETGESTGANSGENAWSATDGADVDVADVVVMDIQMDRMNGIEATRTLVAAEGPPVLILTTYDSEADIVDALSAGALGYLLKDAPEEELHQAVLATACGESTFSPRVGATLARRLGQPLVALSPRETEILRGLSTGTTNQELASTLFISPATVKTHLMHIHQKLGVDNRTAAVHEARNRRLI